MRARRNWTRVAYCLLTAAVACSSGASEDGGETHWLGDCDAEAPCPPEDPRSAGGQSGREVTPRCGDGSIDPGEDCDGAELGGATCASSTMNAMPFGTVSCSGCALVLSGCRSSTEAGAGGTPPGRGGAGGAPPNRGGAGGMAGAGGGGDNPGTGGSGGERDGSGPPPGGETGTGGADTNATG